MKNISFNQIMYAYAAETTVVLYEGYYPAQIKVYMPDMFPDKKQGAAIDYKINNGSAKNTIINNNIPPISDFANSRNYLILPTMLNMHVAINDKLIVGFVNGNPRDGIILGKANKDG